jgi:hypothetical protein
MGYLFSCLSFFISEIVFALTEDDAPGADLTLLDKEAATGDEVMGTERDKEGAVRAVCKQQADGWDQTAGYGLERTNKRRTLKMDIEVQMEMEGAEVAGQLAEQNVKRKKLGKKLQNVERGVEEVTGLPFSSFVAFDVVCSVCSTCCGFVILLSLCWDFVLCDNVMIML